LTGEHKPGPTPARLTEQRLIADISLGPRSRSQGDRRGAPNSRDSTTKHTGLKGLPRSCAFAVVAVGHKRQQTACSVSVSVSWPRSARASANPDGEQRHVLARLNARCAHQADLCRLLDHLRSHRRHSSPAPEQASSQPNSCARPRENATAEMAAHCWRPAPATAYGRQLRPRRSIPPGPAGRLRVMRPRPGRAWS
jgi:hypothetical protein